MHIYKHEEAQNHKSVSGWMVEIAFNISVGSLSVTFFPENRVLHLMQIVY